MLYAWPHLVSSLGASKSWRIWHGLGGLSIHQRFRAMEYEISEVMDDSGLLWWRVNLFSKSYHLGWMQICPSLRVLVHPFFSSRSGTSLPTLRNFLPWVFFSYDSMDQSSPHHCCSPTFLHSFYRVNSSILVVSVWICCVASVESIWYQEELFCKEKGNCMALQTFPTNAAKLLMQKIISWIPH